MSSEAPVPVPRTGVPIGIGDPVEQARAELKAALAAIEEKTNVPRRVERAASEKAAALRRAARRNPALVVAGVVSTAALVGGAVWGLVRLYTR